ncbi:MAG: hypothetical protein AB8B56_21350 [Crocinitomicaceae bacterium]
MRVLSLIILILLVGLFSCKKHRLKGEKAILEGTWEWCYSLQHSSLSSPPFTASTDTVFPVDVSSNYQLIFLKKGKVQLYENNELKQEYRTVFKKFENVNFCLITNNSVYFEMYLDNDENRFMDGCVSSDSLSIRYVNFPFSDQEYVSSSVWYTDFFTKVD